MKKLLRFVLVVLILVIIAGAVLSRIALVTVSSEKASFVTGVSETGAVQSTEVNEGDLMFIVDCDIHDWRKAKFGLQSGLINLRDVNVLFGNLPQCDYAPTLAPPEDLPDDVWKKELIPNYQHRC
jgi:hypothetical protein